MKAKFDQLEVQRELGVAPATAERVAGLLEGRVNPDHFRSVEGPGLLEDMGVVQHDRILRCIVWLLNAGGVSVLNEPENGIVKPRTAKFVDRGDDALPTVILFNGSFGIMSVNEFAEPYLKKVR